MKADEPISFTIPVPPRTKKNHSRIVRTGRRFRMLPSEAYERYETEAMAWIAENRPELTRMRLSVPVRVSAVFYVDAARRVDINGLNQGLHDMMVKAGILADDSAINPQVIVSTDGTGVMVDRKNPRTAVTITPLCSCGSDSHGYRADCPHAPGYLRPGRRK